MRLLLIFIIFVQLIACSQKPPLVAVIPVTQGCHTEAMQIIKAWNEKYEGTKVKMFLEFVPFPEPKRGVSPVTGYINMYAGGNWEPDKNLLEKMCLYDSGGRILSAYSQRALPAIMNSIAKSVSNGASELYIKFEDQHIEVRHHSNFYKKLNNR